MLLNLLEPLNGKLPYLKFTSNSFSCETFTGIFISTAVTKASEVNVQYISWILMDGQCCWWTEAKLQVTTTDGHPESNLVLIPTLDTATPARICLKNKKAFAGKKALMYMDRWGNRSFAMCPTTWRRPCNGCQTESKLRRECVGWEALWGTEKSTRIWNHIFKTVIQNYLRTLNRKKKKQNQTPKHDKKMKMSAPS